MPHLQPPDTVVEVDIAEAVLLVSGVGLMIVVEWSVSLLVASVELMMAVKLSVNLLVAGVGLMMALELS